MPRFNDAVGYLGELSEDVNETWFTMICHLAVAGKTNLTPVDIQTLTALYSGNASYTGLGATPPSPPTPTPTATADSLEELSNFSHFKAIQPALKLSFPKRLTLIFGTNGSGKSSLCEALKLLGNPDPPIRPLQNKRASIPGSPVFSFKFSSDRTPTQWSQAMGFGPRRAAVKYFDTALAFKNTKGAVDPGRVIALTPFKLHIFELVKNLTTQFREHLQKARNENATALNQDLEKVRQTFARFKKSILAGVTDGNVADIKREIAVAEAFDQQTELSSASLATPSRNEP